MGKRNRRKTVMINLSFQLKMIFVFLSLNVILMVSFQAVLYFFMDSEINALLSRTHITLLTLREMLFPLSLTLSFLNIIISSLIITAFVLFASFRIAGPLYRFQMVVRDISERNLDTYTKIRNYDQLNEFAEEIGRMKKILADDIMALKDELVTAESACGEGSLSAKQSLERMKDILERYRLPNSR